MANERYLVLNRHGTSIMKTFFTEAVGPDSRFSLRTRTHYFFFKLAIQNIFLSLRIRVGRFCPLGQNLVVLTRLKPSCPKPLEWTKLDKTSKFNLIHKFTVISKFIQSLVQVLSKCCSWLP